LKKGLNGWILAKCVDVKGAVSQGRNLEEAVRKAISAILEDIYGEERIFNTRTGRNMNA